MTNFLKNSDRVRSLVRGMEADLKLLSLSSELSATKVKNRVKKNLDELSEEVTNLYPYIEDSTISQSELVKRQGIIAEFEKAQREIEEKLCKADKEKEDREKFDRKKDVEMEWVNEKSRNVRQVRRNRELSSQIELIEEIDKEIGENNGLMKNGIAKMNGVAEYAQEHWIEVLFGVLGLVIIFYLFG